MEMSSAHHMTSSEIASHAAVNIAPVILPPSVSSNSQPCCARPERLPGAAGSSSSAPSPFSGDSSLPADGPVPLSPLVYLASQFFAFQV